MATPAGQMGATNAYNRPAGGKQFYIDQMFNLGGAAVTSLTSMNPSTTAAAGAYTCLVDGFLEKIIIKITPQAATSLAQSGYVQLNATSWAPANTLTCPFNGFGLATAPQAVGGAVLDTVYPPVGDGYLHLPVKTSVKINGSIIYFFSPVTPNAVVCGLFSC